MRIIAPNNAPSRRAKTNQPTASARPYDPVLDGWNVHKLRHTPSVDQLLHRRDEAGEDF